MLDEDNVATRCMTCTNPDCTCVLEIVTPCPHCADYICAYGYQMEVSVPGGAT